MRLFDSHCHLHFPQFDIDRAEVLARMQAEGVGAVLVGTDYKTSKAALALAGQHDFLWASVGLHPNDEALFDAEQFEVLARDQKVVAIGECGLDYFRLKPDGPSSLQSHAKAQQKEKFGAQVALAEKLQKPLIIHCREAHEDMLESLARLKPTVGVVMHFFTGSGELAQKYLALGCYLSFPGPVTYTDMYDDSIRCCPPERLLIETDAPFAAPVPYRGKRNEPPYVSFVAEKVAQTKGIPLEQVQALAVENAQRVFKYRLL